MFHSTAANCCIKTSFQSCWGQVIRRELWLKIAKLVVTPASTLCGEGYILTRDLDIGRLYHVWLSISEWDHHQPGLTFRALPTWYRMFKWYSISTNHLAHKQCSSTNYSPPLGVEVVREFQEFQSSKVQKVSLKDEDVSRKNKRRRCFAANVQLWASICFELDLLMLNRMILLLKWTFN